MITLSDAETYLDAFNWCDGNEFLTSYKIALNYDYCPRWDSYMETQFRLMQQNPLRFVKKWHKTASTIVARYIERTNAD